MSAALPIAGEAERVVLAGILVRLSLPVRGGRASTGLSRMVAWALSPIARRVEARRWAESDAACVQIARRWRWLPVLARAAALESGRGRWETPLRAAAADSAAEVRMGAAELCREAGRPSLLGAIRGLLADPDAAVAEAAERVFVEAGRRASGEDRIEAERQVAAGLEEFDRHRRRGLLAALLDLADGAFFCRVRRGAGGPLGALLSDDGQAFQLSLRTFIKRSTEPMVRGRAWDWLGRGLADAACIERLGRAESAAEHEAVLARMHLAENPRRTVGAARVKGAETVPGAETVAHLSAAARRGLVSWIEVVSLPPEERECAVAALLGDGNAGVRLAALRAAPARLLHDACADGDGRVAASAIIRCSTAGVERRRAPGRPERRKGVPEASCSHSWPAVRILAMQERERQDPWDARSVAGRLAARERLAANPGVFLSELRERLSDREAALPAVLLVRALELQSKLERELVGLLDGVGAVAEADRLAPTVLAALGELNSESARLAVDAHLRDEHERTRANAVEALARQCRRAERADRRADVLVELKADPQHRVRANAVRGLFQRGLLFGERGAAIEEPVAFNSLGAMLSDDRSAHRIAGIWVAGRVLPSAARAGRRWAELAGRITDMSRSDPDAGARVRAARAASRVVAGLREGWAAGAAELGVAVAGGVA